MVVVEVIIQCLIMHVRSLVYIVTELNAREDNHAILVTLLDMVLVKLAWNSG